MQYERHPNSPFAMVAEFQEKFDTPKDKELWLKLVNEEINELNEAFANALKECADLLYVIGGTMNVDEEAQGDIQDVVDAASSPLVGEFFGLILNSPVFVPVFMEVHHSNMSKLGEDGQPIRREDGKIMKGPNYSPADILSIILMKPNEQPIH